MILKLIFIHWGVNDAVLFQNRGMKVRREYSVNIFSWRHYPQYVLSCCGKSACVVLSWLIMLVGCIIFWGAKARDGLWGNFLLSMLWNIPRIEMGRHLGQEKEYPLEMLQRIVCSYSFGWIFFRPNFCRQSWPSVVLSMFYHAEQFSSKRTFCTEGCHASDTQHVLHYIGIGDWTENIMVLSVPRMLAQSLCRCGYPVWKNWQITSWNAARFCSLFFFLWASE